MKKDIGIMLFEQYSGKKNIGSSRIRGHWLAKYWKEAEVFKMGQEYSTIIYQKSYFAEHAKAFKGIKILSTCDPDFMHWGYQVKETIDEVDAVITSTEELAKSIRRFTDKLVQCIPDRLDLEEHKGKKFHQGEAKKAVWFGYSTGFEMLKPVLHFLKKYNIDLIVISDTGFILPNQYKDIVEVTNYPWSPDTIHNDILRGDFVLNPRSSKGKWKFKSNNKTLTSWALGMPVASNVDELIRFINPEERQKESRLRLQEIKDKWDVKISIEELKTLIHTIKQTKNG